MSRYRSLHPGARNVPALPPALHPGTVRPSDLHSVICNVCGTKLNLLMGRPDASGDSTVQRIRDAGLSTIDKPMHRAPCGALCISGLRSAVGGFGRGRLRSAIHTPDYCGVCSPEADRSWRVYYTDGHAPSKLMGRPLAERFAAQMQRAGVACEARQDTAHREAVAARQEARDAADEKKEEPR